ncbi:MAG TPA: PPOX class F420-dependent oxidoreductase [Jatrophihabitans sp.]|nr:PPOX class F420-dependent oxidoreductase [Jatrophihabitans sp.]
METLDELRRTYTVLLTTRRRDGRVVHTPVNFAVDSLGIGYFRTWSSAGTVRRLANFPGVRLCRCSRNGHAQSSDQPAVATRLAGAEVADARRALAAKYPLSHGLLAPLVDRVRRVRPVFYRVVPAEEPTPWTGQPEAVPDGRPEIRT